MRQLRKTIRRILLENTQFYDKLVDMIMSLDSGNINQAIELGETMGFLELHDYEKNEREEYVRGSFSKKETVTSHRWMIIPVPDFLDALEAGWKRLGYDRPIFGAGMFRKDQGMWKERNGFVIFIQDKPSDRRP